MGEITLTIDGQEVKAKSGMTVLEAATKPVYTYRDYAIIPL